MKPINPEEVFNPKDFESIRLVVHFENLTTRMVVKEAGKCNLVELGDKKLVLELPKKTCNLQHNVLIKVQKKEKIVEPSTKEAKKMITKEKLIEIFNTTGKITEFEELEDNLKITVDCLQFEEQKWNELFNLFLVRQEEITNFFKAVKGY